MPYVLKKPILNLSFAVVHSENQQLPCYICNKTFKNERYLKIHLKTHTDQRTFYCTHCSKQFTSKGNLMVHMVGYHSGTKSFKCKYCPMAFKFRGSLWRHMKDHKDKPHPIVFSCERCGESYQTKAELAMHKRKHIKDNIFECDICGKIIHQQKKLARHRALCEKEPLLCELCPDKRFDTHTILRQHKDKHIGAKYRCHCGKEYGMKKVKIFLSIFSMF